MKCIVIIAVFAACGIHANPTRSGDPYQHCRDFLDNDVKAAIQQNQFNSLDSDIASIKTIITGLSLSRANRADIFNLTDIAVAAAKRAYVNLLANTLEKKIENDFQVKPILYTCVEKIKRLLVPYGMILQHFYSTFT